MVVLMIVLGICLFGECLIWLGKAYRQKKRRREINKGIYKLIEERVLSFALKHNMTTEQATIMEYQNIFVCVELLDTKPWGAGVFALDEPITIGRNKENKLCVWDEKISRLHCKISCMNGVFYFHDLGSVKGSVIKRGLFRKIIVYPRTCEVVQNKDLIQIGDYRMKLRFIYGYEVMA